MWCFLFTRDFLYDDEQQRSDEEPNERRYKQTKPSDDALVGLEHIYTSGSTAYANLAHDQTEEESTTEDVTSNPTTG